MPVLAEKTMTFEASDVARLTESQAVVAVEVLKLSQTMEVSEETQGIAASVVRKFLSTRFVKPSTDGGEPEEE